MWHVLWWTEHGRSNDGPVLVLCLIRLCSFSSLSKYCFHCVSKSGLVCLMRRDGDPSHPCHLSSQTQRQSFHGPAASVDMRKFARDQRTAQLSPVCTASSLGSEEMAVPLSHQVFWGYSIGNTMKILVGIAQLDLVRTNELICAIHLPPGTWGMSNACQLLLLLSLSLSSFSSFHCMNEKTGLGRLGSLPACSWAWFKDRLDSKAVCFPLEEYHCFSLSSRHW
jgi:hypothetical protein